MTGRFVCERCGTSFDGDDARCPKCLRKSSVRDTQARGAPSEAMRLASGDLSQTSTARRGSALMLAVGFSTAIAIAISLAWPGLVGYGIGLPSSIGASVSAGTFLYAALRDDTDAPWRAFARRCGLGLGLGLWAFVSGTFALVSTGGLSAGLSLLIGAVVFASGIIVVLRWTQPKEEAPSGKWR